jgi:hypothetical protein
MSRELKFIVEQPDNIMGISRTEKHFRRRKDITDGPGEAK